MLKPPEKEIADVGLRSEPVVGVPGVMVPPIKGIRGGQKLPAGEVNPRWGTEGYLDM